MKSILFPINHPAFTLRQLRWVTCLEKDGGIKPVIFSTVGDHLALMLKAKNLPRPKHVIIPPKHLGWLVPSGETSSEKILTSKPSQSKKLTDYVKMKLPVSFYNFGQDVYRNLRSIRTFFLEISRDRKRIAYIRQLIREQKFSAIVILETSPTYDAPLYAKAAKLEGIPLVTSTSSRDNPQSNAQIYKSDPKLTNRNFLNQMMYVFFRKWFIDYQGKRILRLPIRNVLKQELLGISSPSPWHMVGFLEDWVTVQNEVDKAFYIANGVNSERIHLVGSPEHDMAALHLSNKDEIKKSLCLEFDWKSSKPIIVTSLVQTHWISGRNEAEFHDYPSLLDAWMKPLKEQNVFNVVISLHPSQTYEKMKFLEDDNVRISFRDITEVVIVADLFISCMSTITPLALGAGIPTIIYDVYRYIKECPALGYSSAPGVINATFHSEYSGAIERITQKDSTFLSELKKKQQQNAQNWGLLDGGSTKRFSKLLNSI
jgi:hypothetical protein